MKYKGENTKEIVFPIGGIGSGCIGLAGNGTLRDFEIFNRPNKCSYNKYTSFVVKAENETKVLDMRALNGEYRGSLMGDWGNIGQGVERYTMAGLPCFAEYEFDGEFPMAKIEFSDENFPAKVQTEAYNPFIPMNEDDSSIPCAIFNITFKNITDEPLKYTTAFNVTNPCEKAAYNRFTEKGAVSGILLGNDAYGKDDAEYGDIFVATGEKNISYQEYWRRNSWYEGLEMFWNDMGKYGSLQNRHFDGNYDGEITATLSATVDVAPGEEQTVTFVLGWYYPNCINYWNPPKENNKTWKNYYAKMFDGSTDVCEYVLKSKQRLYEDTYKFKQAIHSQTMPEHIIDAVCANLAVLKSPTCLRLEDGTLYGFEGCSNNEGSCEGSCSHVWNYQYALPFLFPRLERTMRDVDFKYNKMPNGGMSFRLQLPLGREQWNFRPAADAQFGGIIKTYREWKICGDDEWLKKHWETLKENMSYTWSKQNPDRWDPEKTGVLWGRQHHTLDRELFGPNSWLTGYYLLALRAMGEMAEHFGEDRSEYDAIFERGKQWVEENLFNGEYFVQKLNLNDFSKLDKYENADRYYNYETGEINFQVGEGSVIDQVIAGWHANILGLGEVYDKNMVRSALKSLYKYNFKKDLSQIFNPCRIFAYHDEAAMIICEWNDKVYKPKMPVPYSREAMTGFEYQAAVHMISEGLEKEGSEVIKAVRCRYDGKKRNPWNEFECGSNYVRSMASYSALLIYSGFVFNMQRKEIGFKPIVKGDCEYFWSIDGCWGIYRKRNSKISIEILYGDIELERIVTDITPEKVVIDGDDAGFCIDGDALKLGKKYKCGSLIRME